MIIVAVVGAGCGADFNPPQVQLSDYPEHESEAAILYVSKCSGCHAAPLPKIHEADQWPGIVRRMDMRMANKAIQPPSAEDTAVIISYLQ
ncbi:hypothetical protein, partial [Kaarinaea lacus]